MLLRVTMRELTPLFQTALTAPGGGHMHRSLGYQEPIRSAGLGYVTRRLTLRVVRTCAVARYLLTASSWGLG